MPYDTVNLDNCAQLFMQWKNGTQEGQKNKKQSDLSRQATESAENCIFGKGYAREHYGQRYRGSSTMHYSTEKQECLRGLAPLAVAHLMKSY